MDEVISGKAEARAVYNNARAQAWAVFEKAEKNK